jgi:3-hydroxyacyl-[acyl-carrier-protein] dehydratase
VSEVTELLPHRPPFLFVDEVLEIFETGIRTRRTVRAEEPQFEGHYPGRPIMPGVLLCEAALQSGCLFLAKRAGEGQPKGTPVVTRMNDVKFRKMVVPGDVLDIEVEHERSLMNAHFMKAKILVEGKRVMSLSFAVTIAPEEAK